MQRRRLAAGPEISTGGECGPRAPSTGHGPAARGRRRGAAAPRAMGQRGVADRPARRRFPARDRERRRLAGGGAARLARCCQAWQAARCRGEFATRGRPATAPSPTGNGSRATAEAGPETAPPARRAATSAEVLVARRGPASQGRAMSDARRAGEQPRSGGLAFAPDIARAAARPSLRRVQPRPSPSLSRTRRPTAAGYPATGARPWRLASMSASWSSTRSPGCGRSRSA